MKYCVRILVEFFNMFTLKFLGMRRATDAQVMDPKKDAQALREKIPQDILFEVLVGLPEKSLVRFTCVCKSWKSLITSDCFINAHRERNFMKSTRLIFGIDRENCLSLFCPETFSKCLDLEIPRYNTYNFSGSGFGSWINRLFDEIVEGYGSCFVYGSCNGLLLIWLSSFTECMFSKGFSDLYLWNPSIRKCKKLPARKHFVLVGFGFHGEGKDYKVVRIASSTESKTSSIFEVEVYSLRLNSWRRISAVPPCNFNKLGFCEHKPCTSVNGVIYWLFDGQLSDQGSGEFILSFDLGAEVFQKIMLPPTPDDCIGAGFSINVFEKSSIALLQKTVLRGRIIKYCGIWILQETDHTWKMRCKVLLPEFAWLSLPIGFRTNIGGAQEVFIRGTAENFILWDPESCQVRDSGIKWGGGMVCVGAYSSSLVLLD